MTLKKQSFGSKQRVRMRDVASRCEVSISTVSLVLSGDPRIPEDTTRKVLQAVKAMEYRPSVVARSLARRISRTIGVILPELGFNQNQPFYYQALKGIHSQTQPAGFKMVVEAANRGFVERRYHLRLLKEQSADAIIFMAAYYHDDYLSEMEKETYPFILLGSYPKGVDLPLARSNDLSGAKMGTQHLINLGHKAIGHVAGTQEISNGNEREQGYREAMKEGGLSVDPSWVIPGNFNIETAEKATENLLRTNITAIFVGSDEMAYGVLRGLRKNGKRVPEDIAVLGMDDLDMSAWINPPLSTVRYDIGEIASRATKFLIQQIHSPLIKRDMLGEMPEPQLVIRSTCGGKPSGS